MLVRASHTNHAAFARSQALGRHYVQLAEEARMTGDRLGAELFIDLAYEALSIRYDDAKIVDDVCFEKAA